MRRWIVPGVLLVLAAVFRFPGLEFSPPGIFRDELEKGYTAWELWHTGRYGRLLMEPGGRVVPSSRFPLFIDVYGVRTSAVYQWLAAPVVGLGGLSVRTTRLTAAWVGTLTVLLTFFWVRRLWGWKVAAWAGFWLAVSPWHIVFSRWAQQGITEPLWLIATLLTFQKGRMAQSGWRTVWWGLSGFFAGLAFYSYEIARVFLPLWLVFLALTHWKSIRSSPRTAAVAVLVLFVICVPTSYIALTSEGAARFQRISVFGDGASVGQGIALAAKNWLAHFHPGFLFHSGDATARHQLPGLGLMHWVQAPLLALGLLWIFRRRKPAGLLLLAWIALYPISASLTREGIPHALRSIVGLPAWPILCGIGTGYLFRLLAGHVERAPHIRWAVLAVGIILLLAPMPKLIRSLWTDWPREAREAFEQPEQILTDALTRHYGGGEQPRESHAVLHLSGYVAYAPHRLLFHGRVRPADWQRSGLEALPARLLMPGALAHQWKGFAPGDRIAVFAAELQGLAPESYRILDSFEESSPDGQRYCWGLVIEKSR
jgi:hypothetical protein